MSEDTDPHPPLSDVDVDAVINFDRPTRETSLAHEVKRRRHEERLQRDALRRAKLHDADGVRVRDGIDQLAELNRGLSDRIEGLHGDIERLRDLYGQAATDRDRLEKLAEGRLLEMSRLTQRLNDHVDLVTALRENIVALKDHGRAVGENLVASQAAVSAEVQRRLAERGRAFVAAARDAGFDVLDDHPPDPVVVVRHLAQRMSDLRRDLADAASNAGFQWLDGQPPDPETVVRHLAETRDRLQAELDSRKGHEKELNDRHTTDVVLAQENQREIDQLKARVEELEAPVPLILHCPLCHTRHVDEGDQATRAHRTHACQNPRCGHLWAPAVVPTVGVWTLPGCLNAPSAMTPLEEAMQGDHHTRTMTILPTLVTQTPDGLVARGVDMHFWRDLYPNANVQRCGRCSLQRRVAGDEWQWRSSDQVKWFTTPVPACSTATAGGKLYAEVQPRADCPKCEAKGVLVDDGRLSHHAPPGRSDQPLCTHPDPGPLTRECPTCRVPAGAACASSGTPVTAGDHGPEFHEARCWRLLGEEERRTRGLQKPKRGRWHQWGDQFKIVYS